MYSGVGPFAGRLTPAGGPPLRANALKSGPGRVSFSTRFRVPALKLGPACVSFSTECSRLGAETWSCLRQLFDGVFAPRRRDLVPLAPAFRRSLRASAPKLGLACVSFSTESSRSGAETWSCLRQLFDGVFAPRRRDLVPLAPAFRRSLRASAPKLGLACVSFSTESSRSGAETWSCLRQLFDGVFAPRRRDLGPACASFSTESSRLGAEIGSRLRQLLDGVFAFRR